MVVVDEAAAADSVTSVSGAAFNKLAVMFYACFISLHIVGANPHDRSQNPADSSVAVATTPLQKTFLVYSQALDAQNNTREAIYKITRDVTKASKQIIGLLQRCSQPSAKDALLRQARNEFVTVHAMLDETLTLIQSFNSRALAETQVINLADIDVGASSSASSSSLSSSASALSSLSSSSSSSSTTSISDCDSYWRFLRSFNFGLQEYIEAASLYHYLQHGTLITLGQVEVRFFQTRGTTV